MNEFYLGLVLGCALGTLFVFHYFMYDVLEKKIYTELKNINEKLNEIKRSDQ